MLLLGAVWLLNLFDLGFTVAAHELGHFTELNPLAAPLLSKPFWGLLAYKLGLLSAGTVILLRLRRYSVAELACWFLLAAYFYVAVRWNVYYWYMTQDVMTLARAGDSW